MNEYLQAADDARRLLSGFRAVATVADAFEKVGQLQQTQAEAERKLADLTPQIETAQLDLASAKVEAQCVRTVAGEDAEKILREANQALIAARAQAETIVAEANAAADEVRAFGKTVMDNAHAEAAAAEAKRDAAVQELADLEARITRAQAKVAEILKG